MTITALTKYTIEEIRSSILDSFTVYRPKDSTAVGSDAWMVANALAEQIYKLQLRDDQVASWITEEFATEDKLDAQAAQWLPADNQRRAATTWTGTFTLTATLGTPIVPIDSLITINDITYKTTEAVAAIDWSSSTVNVDVESVTTGTSANQLVGTAGTLSSPPAGVSSSCTLASTVTEALDKESDVSLRLRIQNAKRNRPASGNWAHFKEWTESVNGVDKAYVYPIMYGLGTVLVVPVGLSGSSVTSTIIENVKTEINADGHRPVGTILFVTSSVEVPVTCSVNVFPVAGYESDYTFSTANHIAAGPAPTTTVFYTTGTPTIEEGDRAILIYDDGDGVRHTIQRTVSDVDAGTKKVTISEALDEPPLVGSYVYPGGPLWQPIYDAICSEFSKLGTANCTDTRSQRYPYYNTEGCNSTIYASQIYQAIEEIPGTNGATSLTFDGASVEYVTNEISRGATTIPILKISPYITITFGTPSGP